MRRDSRARLVALGLVVVAEGGGLQNPCASSTWASCGFCNESWPLEARISDVLARMSVEEKVSSLATSSAAVASVGLAFYDWWSEAAHGISRVNNSNGTRFESNFALPITASMSFNRSAWRATGAAIGREARAFMNAGHAYSTFWAPVVNLAREPRWGRNIETAGEDPLVVSEYAVAFIRGFERSELDGGARLQAAACCKHFVANSMESSTVAGQTFTRHNFSARVDDVDLVDSYLPPFEACVEEAQVSGVMCSYNALNGVPACADAWLLTDEVRRAWGHDGYVTSDCGAVADVFYQHHYTPTAETTVQAVLRAGTNIDCGQFLSTHGMDAYDGGLATEDDLDAALRPLFRVRMRLGHFDTSPSPLDNLAYETDVCTPETRRLARDVVAQSCVLLKNSKRTLPLSASSGTTLAVVGPTAQLAETTANYYGGPPCDGAYTTLVDALEEDFARVTHAPGVQSVSSDDVSGIPEALALVETADVVVLALGTDLTLARESLDAVDLALSSGQLALASAVSDAAERFSKPTVVVLFTATPLDISPILARFDAILHVGQPSVQTPGVVDVLVGRRSPAGRLVQTWYPQAFQNQISIFDMNLRPGPSAWPRPDCPPPYDRCLNGTNPGRTYRFYRGEPVLDFGFGLSYSTFRYDLAVAPTSFSLPDAPEHRRSKLQAATYAVNVTNEGAAAADDVVLGFLEPPSAGQDGLPLKSLFAFERIHLEPNQTTTVWLAPAWRDFAFPRVDGGDGQVRSKPVFRPLPGSYRVTFGVESTRAYGMGFLDAGHLTAVLERLEAPTSTEN